VWLANTNETIPREEAVLSQIEESSVDGLIVCSSRLPDTVLLPWVEKHEAVVLVNRIAPALVANVVRSRHGAIQRLLSAGEHMLRFGKRHFGYIPLRHSAIQAGCDQYLRILSERGAEVRREWCIGCAPTWQAGYDAGYALLSASPDIDAIICGNDLIALGVLRAAQDLGRRVPEDVALTGCDDILLASQVKPSLTTFRVPTYAIGRMAARLLFRRMEGESTYVEHLYDEELIVRESAP
jgi:LacI family transcriptional regulator